MKLQVHLEAFKREDASLFSNVNPMYWVCWWGT